MSEYIQSKSLSSCNIGKYLTPLHFVQLFPQPKLIDRWKEWAQTLFHKNENTLSCNAKQKQKHWFWRTLLRNTHRPSSKCSWVFDWQCICFVWWRVFQETVGSLMGINCATLLAVLILYSHKADFMQELVRKSETKSWHVLPLHVPLYRWCPVIA